MSPTVRYVVRIAFVAVAGLLASLQANLPGVSLDDLTQALIAGGILGLGYAGVGAATPIEPKVGVKKAG